VKTFPTFPRLPAPHAAVLSAAIFLAAAASGPGRAQPFAAAFDFRLVGIKAGEIVMAGVDGGDTYSAEADVRTAGVVGAFADFFYDGSSEGRVASDGRLIPETFTARSRSPRDDRETRIEWDAGTPVFVSVEPPRSSAPEPSTQGGTLDPVSASFALLRDGPQDEICRKSVDVFDGSRRSRIVLGQPQPEDGLLVCNGSYERLQGEASSWNTSSAYPFRVMFREADGGMARLERIETRTDYGMASLVRR
jgi:Protein of unknown function (DUF3108)